MTPQNAFVRFTFVLLAVLAGSETAAAQQDDTAQPASQPTSAATQESNPLPSPARMIDFFYAALDEGRTDDALGCLSFTLVDPEVAREQGGEYLTRLESILSRLEADDHFRRGELPDDPTAQPWTFGKDPVYVTLERQEDLRWQFSAQTVKDIPDLYQLLDKLAVQPPPPASAPEPEPEPEEDADTPPEQEFDWRQSPHAMLSGLFVKMIAAADKPAVYQEALECLDFSLVEDIEFEQKVKYLRDLYTILEKLVDQGKLAFESLPKEPGEDDYHIPAEGLEIVLKRADDGRWVFAGRTVARIPDMLATLKAQAEKAAVEAGQPAVETPLGAPATRADTSSPRATMNLFLKAMNDSDLRRAVRCLDLSRLLEAEHSATDLLAGKLWMVLNRAKYIIPQELPADEDGPPYAVLIQDGGLIEIGRHRGATDDPRNGEWLFTPASVRSIETLYEASETKPLVPELEGQVRISFWKMSSLHVREYWVPDRLKLAAAGLQLWQWIGIVCVLLLGLLCRQLCAALLPRLSRRLLETEGAAMLPRVLRKAMLPTSTLVMVAAWWGGLQFLDLGAIAMSWTWRVMRILMAFVAVHAVYRLIDVVSGYFLARATRTMSRLDDVLVPLAHKTAKVLVVALGFLFVARTFGFEIGPLLAGFGLGGLAFGLAAQDTLKNFFGSVNVVLDRPFQVGDWVKVGDVEGTVESVGLRSSRLRTFYNSQITVPNSEIMNARIDNMGKRRFRRISCMISVTYDTPPEKLEAFCEGIRELIRTHPYTRTDYFHTYVNKFAASSVDILLYCFHETPDWSTELRERHRLFLDIIRLANRLGVEFAFPTQTVHLHHDSTTPTEASPPPPSPPIDSDGAMKLGRDEATAIVKEAFGETVKPPPPVTF